MKIKKAEHLKHPWKVKQLVPDFRLLDVWQLPVQLKQEHSLEELYGQFVLMNDEFMKKGIAGILFKIRHMAGAIFGWDKKPKNQTLIKGSVRERYLKQEGLTVDQLPKITEGYFIPVYNLKEETLSEIENATVHAALHLGRVLEENNQYSVQLSVYSKSKGVLGHIYMFLISPFRTYIVYPSMMKAIKNEWNSYLAENSI